LLVFTHSFADRASAPRSAAGWSVCLGSLVGLLDGNAADREAWNHLYERYVVELDSNGTFARQGENAEIHFERLFGRPVPEVWDALTNPERLAEWLAGANIDHTEGGRVEIRFATPAGHVVTGVVIRIETPKVLEYSWTSRGEPAGLVKWQLIPVGEQCIVLLTHSSQGPFEEAADMLASWHVHLEMLANAIAGSPSGAFRADRRSELTKIYALALADGHGADGHGNVSP